MPPAFMLVERNISNEIKFNYYIEFVPSSLSLFCIKTVAAFGRNFSSESNCQSIFVYFQLKNPHLFEIFIERFIFSKGLLFFC